jgi:uncharacterized protein YpiB (UPF0302 family)
MKGDPKVKNEKSYTEIMKSRGNVKNKKKDATMLDVYIQMIIDEALFIRKKFLLNEEINKAIDTGNKELFLELASEYKKLLRIPS